MPVNGLALQRRSVVLPLQQSSVVAGVRAVAGREQCCGRRLTAARALAASTLAALAATALAVLAAVAAAATAVAATAGAVSVSVTVTVTVSYAAATTAATTATTDAVDAVDAVCACGRLARSGAAPLGLASAAAHGRRVIPTEAVAAEVPTATPLLRLCSAVAVTSTAAAAAAGRLPMASHLAAALGAAAARTRLLRLRPPFLLMCLVSFWTVVAPLLGWLVRLWLQTVVAPIVRRRLKHRRRPPFLVLDFGRG